MSPTGIVSAADILAEVDRRKPKRRREPAKCGTYAGWNRHKKADEPVCGACREAQAAYARQRRATNKEAREYDRRHNAARSRAWVRLAQEHPRRMRELMREELQRVAPAAVDQRRSA